jgi:hypothetical protein
MEINNFIFSIFVSGILFNMLQDLIMSIINYLNEKAWKVRDYERIIYMNLTPYDVVLDKEIVFNAIKNYEKREIKRKNLDRFLNKFRRKK